MNETQIIRCGWASKDVLYQKYHDEEWGVHKTDDATLFEFLVLESFQAGLSWITILKKRGNFKIAFDDFNYNLISTYNLDKINELIVNEGIIRNRNKIESTISNAKSFINILDEFGSFNSYLESFGVKFPIINDYKNLSEIPPKTELSDRISKDLKERGFKFLGSTIIYAFLQASGYVMDHQTDCFRYSQLSDNK